MTQPVGVKLPRVTTEHTVREWLDALAAGTCNQDDFLQAMQERFDRDPDGNWEVLSLLDQYYRRGKIRAEVFLAIKTSLSSTAVGARETADAGLRQRTDEAYVAPPAAPAPESPREFRPGDVLRSRYRIEGLVGQGGMGTVYEAVDDLRLDVPPNGRTIALKILHAAVTRRSELLTELRRDFQHLQMLSHPNIVRVHEFERDGPVAFFTMEMLHGMLLSRIFTARHGVPLERPQALAILRATGAAIAYAHAAGVMHGDINPQNIFITNDGGVRVLDFGTSHRFVAASTPGDGDPAVPFATPAYASCQVLEGGRPSASDDLFALGCVAYLLLTGKHPFQQRTAIEARESRLRVRRPRGLSGGQWHALQSALHFRHDKRPNDVPAWLEKMDLKAAAPRLAAINDLIDTHTVSYRRYVPIVGSALAGLLLMGGAAWTAANWTTVSQTAADWSGSAGTSLETWVKKMRPGPDPTDFHNFSIKPPGERKEEPAAPSAAVQNPPVPAQTPPPASGVASSPPPGATPPSRAAPVPLPEPAPVSAPLVVQSHSQPPASNGAAPGPGVAPAVAPPARPGSVRIEMAADTLDVTPQDKVAHVTVRRRGNLHAITGFSWWTESGTAKPGTDFAPVATHIEHFEDGQNSAVLSVPLVSTLRAQAKSFYVMIDQSEEGGASVGQRTVTMVTLPPSN